MIFTFGATTASKGGKPGFREVFNPGGRAPREGEIFRNPALANVLRVLSRKGGDAFYKGAITDVLINFSKACGGFFSRQDFARHRATWDAPISTTYRGCAVFEMPPNGQGLAALQMLNILEHFDLRRMGRDSADYWHVMVEAKKLAYADRARYYADPEFVSVPIRKLLSKSYAKKRTDLIDMRHAAQVDFPGEAMNLNQSETTYLCAADADGMMVSLIQSNYTSFGSGYAVPELGFVIQNRGATFSLQDGHPNCLEPGKRPFHTIIPAFVTRNGKPLMAFGVMGGDMQPQGHVQILMNLLEFGMNLQEAGDAPRFYHSGSSEPTGAVMNAGGILHLENGIACDVVESLKKRGHHIRLGETNGGGYQAVWRDPVTNTYAGATEMRKDGCALGY